MIIELALILAISLITGATYGVKAGFGTFVVSVIVLLASNQVRKMEENND